MKGKGFLKNWDDDDAPVSSLANDEEENLLKQLQLAAISNLHIIDGHPHYTKTNHIGEAVELPVHQDATQTKKLCAQKNGFNLHAGVKIAAADRTGLERLCRYINRPAFSVHRFFHLNNGSILYRLPKPKPNGATELILTPFELLEKLSALACGL